MLERWFRTLVCLALVTSATLVRSEELPKCDVQINEDEVVRTEDITKLHNCRTRRFPITLENGFTNDLGHYTGSWKNGKREGEGTMTNWISMGMTTRWENDRPSNGLASLNSCTSRTHGYVYNGRFLSFTLPIDWLARVTQDWGLSWLAELLFGIAGLTQSLLSVVLD
jgi:hypothetical protein